MAARLTMVALAITMLLAFTLPAANADEGAAAAEPVAAAEEAAADGEENDETKAMIAQLAISMISEIVDENHFIMRDSEAKTGKKRVLVRLGNTAPIEKGELSDEDFQAKKDAGKETLAKLIGKQMVWWKAAPEEHQPKAAEGSAEDPVMLADVWLIDGRHINTHLRDQGHLTHVQEYESELARNILTAHSDEKKKESYKELEVALKESEEARKKEAKEAAKEAEANIPVEPLGIGAWIGLAMLALIIIGVATNFGKGSASKRPNLNRKKGFFEKLFGGKGKSQ
jgi:hypothetical protein